MDIGFDLISDLNLSPGDTFNWENKATSLYCLVAGNISFDMKIVATTLNHLSNFYHGVFYVPGSLEFDSAEDYRSRLNELNRICRRIEKVVLLHHHVVIINGIAVLGCTGWYGNEFENDFEEVYKVGKFDDLIYLKNSLEKLQKHLDVRKILILTNAVPNEKLYFGEIPEVLKLLPDLSMIKTSDSEDKISHWAYGTYNKIVDTKLDNVNYICNPYNHNDIYYAKRITVDY